jgi:hypothetical protein
MRGIHRFGTAATLCLLLSGCQVTIGPQRDIPGFLEVEWRGATSDTIDALIEGVVVAQVFNTDGRPITARFIRFTALPLGEEQRPGVFLAPEGSTPNQPTVQILSDPSGISVASVRLGTVPGQAGIWVTVFELEEADTVFVEVFPGSAHQLQLSPRDTSIALGGSFRVRYALGDFYANPVDGPVALTGSGAISLAGDTVTGTDVGTGAVLGVSGVLRDSVDIQVTAPSRRR